MNITLRCDDLEATLEIDKFSINIFDSNSYRMTLDQDTARLFESAIGCTIPEIRIDDFIYKRCKIERVFCAFSKRSYVFIRVNP